LGNLLRFPGTERIGIKTDPGMCPLDHSPCVLTSRIIEPPGSSLSSEEISWWSAIPTPAKTAVEARKNAAKNNERVLKNFIAYPFN